jgi:hypothetical protein
VGWGWGWGWGGEGGEREREREREGIGGRGEEREREFVGWDSIVASYMPIGIWIKNIKYIYQHAHPGQYKLNK